MSISSVIRSKRKEIGLTQEQVAVRLGVTAPAVNKWENGLSCPDIMLLSPLARLLETDVNTLLSFNENLADQEVAEFSQKICEAVEGEGIEEGFRLAGAKIQEYPNCRVLIYSMAVVLEYLLRLHPPSSDSSRAKYEEKIFTWYAYAAKEQENAEIRDAAKTMLISRYMREGKYDEAGKLADSLPGRPMIDKCFFQCDLLIKQNQIKEARRIIQRKLMKDITEVQGSLTRLMNMELEYGELKNAEVLAKIIHETTKLFDMWEYNGIVPFWQISLAKKDAEKSTAILKELLKKVVCPWNFKESPLYYEIAGEGMVNTGERFLPGLLAELENEPEYEFLFQNEEFRELIEEYRRYGNIGMKSAEYAEQTKKKE